MTVPTFDQLMTANTRDDYLSSELYVATELDLPVEAWQPVDVAREILYINAQMLANQSEAILPTVRGGLLDYAEGDWLTLLADQVYDTQRIDSTFATGPIQLVNSSATPHTFAAGEMRVLNATTGKTYTSTTGGTLVASGTLTLQFAADEPGSASNLVSGNTLALVVDVPSVGAQYVSALVGVDRESDPQLRERCRQANAKASPNGPADAYDYFAKTATRTDGTSIGVTRTNKRHGNGTVTIYVADADGTVTSPDVAIIESTLNANCVPTGITVLAFSAAASPINLVASVVKSPSSTAANSELTTRITAALTEYFSTLDVGGVKASSFSGVYLDTLTTVCRVALAGDALAITITTPSSNVALGYNQVPTMGTVTVSYTS